MTSYLDLLAEVIADEREDYALVVHDDTYFSVDSFQRISAFTAQLDAEWPNWGVCGNAGISAFPSGQSSSNVIRYLFDPHGGPSASEFTVPAQTIDGNTMLMNCRALREARATLPKFVGFHFYDIILSIECLASGLAVLVSPALACFHDSGGSQDDFDLASRSDALKNYLSSRLLNNRLATLNGNLNLPLSSGHGRIDIEIESLVAASKGRKPISINILVRSQFRHPAMLLRTLQSIKALAIAARAHAQVRSTVLTDKPEEKPDFVENWADETLSFGPYKVADSRALLLRDGVKAAESDFIWIVDDDDWLFPNEAKRLAMIVATCPPSSIIFVGSTRFLETIPDSGLLMGPGYQVTLGQYFPPSQWIGSLAGQNHIPICGMLVSTNLLKSMPAQIFTCMEYYEDYALQLLAISEARFPPIVIDKSFSGISVRDMQSTITNSITEKDRSKWNRSLGELSSLMANHRSRSIPLMSTHSAGSSHEDNRFGGGQRVGEIPLTFSYGERKAVLLFRVLRGLSLFLRHPHRSGFYISAAKQGFQKHGLKGAIIALANDTVTR